MSTRTTTALALALASVLGACGDDDAADLLIPEPGECAGGTCEVRGVDLVLGGVAFAEALEPGDPYPVVWPGDTVHVAWSVRNRGDETAPATTLAFRYQTTWSSLDGTEVTQPIPALAPGDSVAGVTPIVIEPPASLVPWSMATDSVVLRASLVDLNADPFFANDTASLPPVTIATPKLEGRIRPLTAEVDPDGRPVYMPGDTVLWERVVWNSSEHAASPDTTLMLCTWIWPGDGGCEADPVPFPALPAIQPGDTLVDTLGFALDLSAIPWPADYLFDGIDHAGAYLCATAPGTGPWWDSCFAWGDFQLLPSFENYCAITPLELGTSAGASAPDCTAAGPARDVWRLQVTAGGVYDVAVAGRDIRIHDADGRRFDGGNGEASFVAATTGHVFVVIASGSYTVTATRRF